jgi:hypothetical protein
MVSLAALMILTACGPAVTETTSAPSLTIVLSATIRGPAGCFVATPDPARVGIGRPFNFRNNTTVSLELIRSATGALLTTVPDTGVSPTIVVHTVLDHEDYYSKTCASEIHRVTLGDSGTVALRW